MSAICQNIKPYAKKGKKTNTSRWRRKKREKSSHNMMYGKKEKKPHAIFVDTQKEGKTLHIHILPHI